MIWFAWRRQRTQVLVSLGVIALAALLMVLTAALWRGGDRIPYFVTDVTRAFLAADGLVGLSMILGIFAGAPLFAREASRGTHTFVFTQSVSRWRWFASRALVATVPIAVALVGLALLYSRLGASYAWSEPEIMESAVFRASGSLLAAYFLLTTAIGAVAGLFVKNTVAAMAITLVVYLIVSAGIGAIRPHLLPAHQQEVALEKVDGGLWSMNRLAVGIEDNFVDGPDKIGLYVDSGYIDGDGAPVEVVEENCRPDMSAACAKKHGAVAGQLQYQPNDRYWSLQSVETTAVVAITAALVGFGAWRLRTWYP